MPPELALTRGGVAMCPHLLHGLLVKADVEETGASEDLAGVADHVLTDAVIVRRRNHPMIFAQPGIVAGGEVQLGDDLDADRLQPRDLRLHPLGRPRALHRQLGMARILQRLAQVEDQRVHADLGHARRPVHPLLLLEVEMVDVVPVAIHRIRVRRVLRSIPPHVRPEVHKLAPHEGLVR